jgi:predicted PurR-regulated permease PerM
LEIKVPRWAQAILILVGVVVVFYVARAMSNALFAFVLSVFIVLLLNPLVLLLGRLKVPRGVAVTLVYLAFLALLVLLIILALPPLINQAKGLLGRVPEWGRALEEWLEEAQVWLEVRGVNVNLPTYVGRLDEWLQTRGTDTVGVLFRFGTNVVASLVTGFMIIIISFYMLADGKRLHKTLVRVLPGGQRVAEKYLDGVQRSFITYVKGQSLLATSVGLAAGLGVWILGWDVVAIWPEGSRWAFLFGVWAGVTEVIPYVGPWLGAIPPLIAALFHSPEAAIWVGVIYLVVQLLESHILTPNIMGTTIGVHPLVVIFAVLAGAQIAGILGMLLVAPVLAMLRHTLNYYNLKWSRAPWVLDDGVILRATEHEAPGCPSGDSEEKV